MSEKMVYQPHKSSLGNLDANVPALLTYLAASIAIFIPGLKYLAWLAPGLLYVLEKSSKLVKSHAAQALTINIIGSVVLFILKIVGWIITKIVLKATKPTDIYDLWNYYGNRSYKAAATVGTIFLLVSLAVRIIILVFEILAMINAYKYSEYKIPVIGSLSEKLAPLLDKIDLGGSKAPKPTQGNFDPQTGQPIAPQAPQAPPQAKFDPQTGQPIAPQAPPVPPQAKFDPQTGQPIAPQSPPPSPSANFDPQTGQPLNQNPPADNTDADTTQ
ncbi:MAG TPA: DUF4870 domain-containing protein [Clostridiales bacterium]|nr:DUF4870 domain-containing protein [Clostridiales bacterium]